MENEDLIRKKMEETRTSLTEKLETLEEQVAGTVQGATSAVSDTVETVKDSVEETVSTVKDTVQDTVGTVKDTVQETVEAVKETVQDTVETVKGWFDLSAHVEQHPWLVMGGSVLLGYCLETLVGRAAPAPRAAEAAESGGTTRRGHHHGNGGMRHRRHERAASDLGPEFGKLKGLALGALLGTARELILKAVPNQMANQLGEIIDNMTRKIGGEPISREAGGGPEERGDKKAGWQQGGGPTHPRMTPSV